MSSHLYIEGGESKEDQIRCREGFRKLLEKAGFSGRMPRLSACGGRGAAFDDFKTAHARRRDADYVAMLVDSEDPLANLETTWDHLKVRDQWDRPNGASDEQVLFMTTCMETWIVSDRSALQGHYGHKLQANALPPLNNLESRNRHEVHDSLTHASRNCSNAYAKGKRSFEVVGKLDPAVLRQHLLSF
ncbi:MAG: DUF4276 family protein, partial [Planctomycetota bacterium]|nr:DUF4276 family protein [Planctomycetota bacterium]